MLSWPTATVMAVLRARRRLQPSFMTSASIGAWIERDRLRPPSFAPPRRLLRRFDVSRTDVEDWPLYRVRPIGLQPVRRVVYLHGGMYVGEITGLHWALIAELAAQTPAEVWVPVYPLADRVGAAGVVATGVRLVRDLLTGPAGPPLVLAGDSAGGGLALAVCQQLLLRDGPAPHGLVLVAPWLDARCADPRQPALDRRDPLIRSAGLRAAATAYAGDLPLTDPRVSPLLGPMSGLPPMTVFTGDADVLHPDSLRLADAARAAGVAVELRVLADGPHDYPLLPPPLNEGRAGRWEVVRAVRR